MNRVLAETVIHVHSEYNGNRPGRGRCIHGRALHKHMYTPPSIVLIVLAEPVVYGRSSVFDVGTHYALYVDLPDDNFPPVPSLPPVVVISVLARPALRGRPETYLAKPRMGMLTAPLPLP